MGVAEMAEYLSFEEVASILKCNIKKVRRLVIEEKSLGALRLTPNGLVLKSCGLSGHFPYDLDFNCHLDDDGAITSDIYRLGKNGETEKVDTIFVGYLRIEDTELDRFILKNGPVDQHLEATRTITHDTASPQTTTTAAPLADSGWVAQAQARAREIVKESRACDRYPNQETLGDRIATEFRKAGIVGADGKPLSGATIKRHALKGISSAIGKQLSTTIRRGN